ncbi:MAG: hypothetical protein Kow0020_15880 [Wenzhouxiangellaceae bacterium]
MSEDDKDIQFDTGNLYRVEVFTDQKTGSIRRMTPVDADGNPDPSRAELFVGEATAMTPAGPLPLTFELEGSNLAEAAKGFAQGAEQALRETIEELRRLQREQQSSIVVPGQSGPAVPGAGGLGPGAINPLKR